MMGLLLDHVYVLILVVGFAFIAVGQGRLVLSGSGISFVSFSEMVLLCFGVGLGLLSLVTFCLASIGILYHETVIMVLVLCAMMGIWGWLKGTGFDSYRKKTASRTSLSALDCWVLGALGIILVGLLLLVLTPAVGKDALIYHLAAPRLFLKHHGFYFIEGNIFAHYPLGQEMIYILALVLKGEVVAKGLHFSLALFLLVGMWQLCRSYLSDMDYKPLALIVFITIPTVFSVSHMAYNDLAVSFYTFLAVYSYLRWFRRGEIVSLILCGVFVGFALGTKYTALFLPFLAVLGITWGTRHHNQGWRHAAHSLLFFIVPAFFLGIPTYLKNWFITGNPFYPFFYGIFGGRGWDPEQAHLYDLFVHSLGMGRGWLDYVLLPWNLSFHAEMASPRYDGIVGPIFFLTLPFVLGIRKMTTELKTVIVFCLLMFFFWASSAQQIRYLIPVFPFLAILVAYILSYYKKRKWLFAVLVATIVGGLTHNVYYVYKEFRSVAPIGVITGRESQRDFIQRIHPLYEMYEAANTMLPDEAKVFVIYMKNFSYLCERACYSDAMFETYTLQKILSKASSVREAFRILKEKGFTHLMYDDDYVTGKMSTLSAEQKKLFDRLVEHYTETLKVGQGRYFLRRLV